MARGKVDWFNSAKGYGFIRAEGIDEDIFVHYSDVKMQGYKRLVADELMRGPKGAYARNVERLWAEAPA